ncbi:MAG TPA: hypothetical protein VKY56_10510 [Chloroflexota bacterium]|nr:hypothetical protein [Chloroflexota bacterium]
MLHREISTDGVNTVEVQTRGRLLIDGVEGVTLHLAADVDDPARIAESRADGILRLEIQGEARIQLPRRCGLRVTDTGGDVQIIGTSTSVEVVRPAGDVRIRDISGALTVHGAAGDVDVRMARAEVTCTRAAGDVRMRDIDGDLHLAEIAGDLVVEQASGTVTLDGQTAGDAVLLRTRGPVHVTSIAGDLVVTECDTAQIGHVAGDLRLEGVHVQASVDEVAGDCILDNCDGPISLGRVIGDLRGRTLGGGITALDVGGEVRVHTPLTPRREYQITASGPVTFLITGGPSEVSATFEIHCPRGRLHLGAPLDRFEHHDDVVRGQLGAGEAVVRISSRCRIRLLVRGREEGIERAFESFVDELVGGIGAEVRETISTFHNEGTAQREQWERRWRELNERLTRLSEEMAHRTAERIERAMRQAERSWQSRAAGGARGGPWSWLWQPPPHARPTGPSTRPAGRSRATGEERLTVLRMLAEGKITVEQAAALLEALED